MKRRPFLALAGGSLAAGLAGCSDDGSSAGGDGTPTPQGATEDCEVASALGDAPTIPVTADGTFADAKATVNLRWTVRSQRSVKESADAMLGYRADEGETYLVFRFEVTNPTDRTVTIDRFNFRLEYLTPDVVETVGPAIF